MLFYWGALRIRVAPTNLFMCDLEMTLPRVATLIEINWNKINVFNKSIKQSLKWPLRVIKCVLNVRWLQSRSIRGLIPIRSDQYYYYWIKILWRHINHFSSNCIRIRLVSLNVNKGWNDLDFIEPCFVGSSKITENY